MRRPAPGTDTLTAAVATGFGVLGWLAAQLVTLHVFGHGHANGAGDGFRHMHGLAGPLAVSAAFMAAAALIALRLLPESAATRPLPRRGITLALPTIAFAALEVGDAVVSGGARPGPAVAVLVTGAALQMFFAWAAQEVASRCVDVVTTPWRLEAPFSLLPTLRPAPVECVPVRSLQRRAGFPARAPPSCSGS